MQSTSLRQLISNRVQNHVVTTIVQTKDPCRSVIVVNEYLKVTTSAMYNIIASGMECACACA